MREALLDLAQRAGQNPFHHTRADRPRADGLAAAQQRLGRLEHGPHDLRHARHDEDVLDAEAGRDGHGVVHQFRPFGHQRHALARLGELAIVVAVPFLEPRIGDRMMNRPPAERLGDGFRRYVVVGRADAAGREDVGIACPERVHGRHDLVLDVRDDAHLAQLHPDLVEALPEEGEVRVLHPAGEDFVADDAERGGNGIGTIGHGGTRSRRAKASISPCDGGCQRPRGRTRPIPEC